MQGGYKLKDKLAALDTRQAHGDRPLNVTRENILTCDAGIGANHIMLAIP